MRNASDSENEKENEKIFLGEKRSKFRKKLSLTKYKF